jgi:SAM-dependent methyltransferase
MAIVKRNIGHCHCCRNTVVFQSNEPWLRDHYKCAVCLSIPRQRHLQYILDRYHAGWENKKIHESSSSNDFISRYAGENFSHSQFFSYVKPGEYFQQTRCENLERLSFPDCIFDIFITQDVFEHIFNPNLAAREIMRVLKSDGVHILEDSNVVHLKEQQYHGNPVGDGRSLVTWDYGDDFEFLLSKWSGFPTVTYITHDERKGIDGEYLEVFVVRKM